MPTPINNTSKLFIAALKQLPPLMQAVINNPALIDNMIAIDEQYKLSPKQSDALMGIERRVIIQQLPVANVPAEIQQLGLGKEITKKLALDFLGRILLPMEWYVGGVQTTITELNGRTEEYLYHARRQFPEVYAPQVAAVTTESLADGEHPLLRNFEQKVESTRGRADILLRLTGLSVQVDEAMGSGKISQADGEEVLRNLDTLSYAVNTKDLNPLEVQSLKRRLRKVLGRMDGVST